MTKSSLEVTDELGGRNATHPRVSLQSMEEKLRRNIPLPSVRLLKPLTRRSLKKLSC